MRSDPRGTLRFARRRLLVAGLCAAGLAAWGGTARADRPEVFAITGARAITAPGKTLDNATIVLRDGLIEAIGGGVKPPADAVVIEGAGRTITAGFIDGCTDIGQKKADAPAGGGGTGPGGGGPPQGTPQPPPGAGHPLARVHPERRVIDTLITDATAFEKHRAMGFTTALTLPGDGIFRGQAALIDLGSSSPAGNVVRAAAGQVLALEYGGFGQSYPTSLMGSIAAVRQALLDAQRRGVWEARYQADPSGMRRPDAAPALDALGDVVAGRAPILFDVPDSANLARALAVAKEFSLDAVIIGSGLESAQHGALEAIKSTGRPIIVPLAFPEKPKVDDADEALNTTLRDLERWYAAPENPARLQQAGIPFALGTCRLTSVSEFPEKLRKAIGRGLSADAALAALTTTPARILGVDKTLGTLEPGKIANLVVFEGAPADGEGIFSEKSKPVHVFVDGVKYDVEKKKSKGDPNAKVDPRGTWTVTFTIGGRTVNRTWTIAGKAGDYTGTAETQAGVVGFSSVKLAGNEMTVVLPPQGNRPSQEVVVVITGDAFEGGGEGSGGFSFTVKGTRTSGPEGGAL